MGATMVVRPCWTNWSSQYAVVRVVHLDNNHGQTAAFDAGFRQASGALIATMDGDLQYDPNDFSKLLPLVKQFDWSVGDVRLDMTIWCVDGHPHCQSSAQLGDS